MAFRGAWSSARHPLLWTALTSCWCFPSWGAGHSAQAQAPAQGGAQATQLGLGHPPLRLHAGKLCLQALRPALGRTQPQPQLRGLDPHRLQPQLQAPGHFQLLLLGAVRLLQGAQQASLPRPELSLLLLQLPLGSLKLGR